jgi:adenylate kinase
VRIALVGEPGAGKGTQGRRLADHFGVPLISAGEFLRRRAHSGGVGAEELSASLSRGELVPDDIVLSVVNDAISATCGGGYILDGFPRTIGQATNPDAPPLDAVIHLAVPDDVAHRRIATRAGAGRLDDARPEATARRLELFHTETEPVLDFYRRRGLLATVDGTAPPDGVTAAIVQALDVRRQLHGQERDRCRRSSSH